MRPRTSRRASAASITSRCPGRNSAMPKRRSASRRRRPQSMAIALRASAAAVPVSALRDGLRYSSHPRTHRGGPMARKPSTKKVTAEDVDPRHRWDRPLQAPGHMQVDFEERVDFRRLHAYRLGRARQALAPSDLGAVLVFDQYNIRYLSGTVIGEWARDKLTRWCLLTGTGEPWVWDFGSAARHHRLYAPQIAERQSLAGMVGMRGAVSPKAGLFTRSAQEIRSN